MKFKELCAVLILYRSNFENLHWNCIGEDFNDSHKSISTEYYELVNKNIDIIAEMIARLGDNAPNFTEVLNIVTNSERNYMVVDSGTFVDRCAVIEKSQVMLGDIIELIVECLDSEEMKLTINAGIKSVLETILEEFDIQHRYINKRRTHCLTTCNNKCCDDNSVKPENPPYPEQVASFSEE